MSDLRLQTKAEAIQVARARSASHGKSMTLPRRSGHAPTLRYLVDIGEMQDQPAFPSSFFSSPGRM